jgi:GDP-4-dehydro-6-deoxy-D-mannose reductase
MRRAIVTGADGFLGRHLVQELERRGVAVTALARRKRPGAPASMHPADWSANIRQIIEATAPEVIFQLAGRVSGTPAELEQANLGTTRQVMTALRALGAAPLLVCCGSAAEYGAAISDGTPVDETALCVPASLYGAMKLAQTNAVLEFSAATGVPVLVARIFNAIGPGMPAHLALGDFVQQLVRLPPAGMLLVGNLGVSRDFADVADIAGALASLAQNPEARGVVNICSGRPTRLQTLVDRLIAHSGRSVSIQPVAERMRPGELGVIVGSTARLGALGATLPPPAFDSIMARIWRHAQATQPTQTMQRAQPMAPPP